MVIPIPTEPDVEGLHGRFAVDQVAQKDAIVLGIVFLVKFIKA
jgi:hypothetical protein